MRASTNDVWDRHWATISSDESLFGRLASFVRIQVLSRAVRHYGERFFPDAGLFFEAGCGSAQSSSRLLTKRRRLAALDFSLGALQQARRVPAMSSFLQGDITRLPFADDSVSGIWNLGVMEHFEAARGDEILREFRRVLKPGAVAILFWPPEFGLSRKVLAPVERFLSWKRGHAFSFFPDEVNRLTSRRHARETLERAGLEPAAVDFTPRDLFIHVVAVARKPGR